MSFIAQPQTLFAIGPSRQFGGLTSPPGAQPPAAGNDGQPIFKGYVVLNEAASDTLTITKQPVQQGAPITDHAFKNPTTFSIQILFGAGFFGAGSDGDSLATIYKKLLALQSSFVPFNCITPKRTYFNMLFQSLAQDTNKKTENVLSIHATFQQIITVPIGITTVSRSQLKNAGSNGATQPAGSKSLQSSLYKIFSPTSGLQ